MGTNLGPQFETTKPLPGMDNIRQAEPHEQTEKQFHNRPDVMVHGRFVHTDYMNQPGIGKQMYPLWKGPQGFHAGTEQAAHDRIRDLAPAEDESTARFFHGRVDPAKMRNQPSPGKWEAEGQTGMEHQTDPGRHPDQQEEWEHEHHNTYYRNDYEDKGSTAAILPVETRVLGKERVGAVEYNREEHRPGNFTTWRSGVSEALASGAHVPAHVKGIYDASGGEGGPHHVLHASQFGIDRHNSRQSGSYATQDEPMLRKFGRRWVPGAGL